MLTISNISVSYDGSRILRGVNLTVPEHGVVCLMGRNGVGKSTTLKTIVGLVKIESGSVRFADTDSGASSPTSVPGLASVSCRKAATFFHI